MQFSLSVVALVASLVSASAGSLNAGTHANLHRRVHSRAHPREITKRTNLVQANANIQTFPAQSDYPHISMGGNGAFVNTIINNSTDHAKVYFWEGEKFELIYSVYNQDPAQAAFILDLPAGSTQTVSFSDAFSGAYAAVFDNTQPGNAGNFGTAYVELNTFPGQWQPQTVDVSFEPNPAARLTSVSTATCQSDISSCSFICNDKNAPFCGEENTYTLQPASAPEWTTGCHMGFYGSQPSGGCALSPQFTTTFS